MTRIVKRFEEYYWKDVHALNREISKTFGRLGVRWRHTMAYDPAYEPKGTARCIVYSFDDDQDATMFVLKFGGELYDEC